MDNILRPVWSRKAFFGAGPVDSHSNRGAAVLQNGNLCVPTGNDHALVVEPATGAIAAQLQTFGPVNSLVTSGEGEIFLAVFPPHTQNDAPHRYYVFDEVTLERQAEIVEPDIEKVLGYHAGRVYGGMRTQGEIHPVSFGAVNAQTAEELWRTESTGFPRMMAIHGSQIIVGCQKPPAFQVFTLNGGSPSWTLHTGRFATCMGLVGDIGYFGSSSAEFDGPEANGRLECRNIATGTVRWRVSDATFVPNQIMATEDELYVAYFRTDVSIPGSSSEPAYLARLDPETGDEIWRVHHGNRRMGVLGLADNLLYVPMVERGPNDLPGGGLLCLNTRDGSEVFRSYFGWMRGIFAQPVPDGVVFATFQEMGFFKPVSYWTSALGSVVRTTPVAMRQRCIVGTSAGDLICLTEHNGSEVWRMPGHEPITSSVSVHRQLTFLSQGSLLRAVTTAGGREIWSLDAGDRITGRISSAFHGELSVAFGTLGGSILICSGPDGQIVLRYEAGSEASTNIHIGDAQILAGFEDGTLRAVSYDGVVLWDDQFQDIPRCLIVRRGMVISADEGGTVRAHDLTSGDSLWQVRLDHTITSRQIHEWMGHIFLTDAIGRVTSLSVADGSTAWTSEPLAPGGRSSLFVNEMILVVSEAGQIVLLDPDTGALIRSYALGHAVTSDIAVHEVPFNPDPRDAHAAFVADETGAVHRLII